MGSLIDIQQNTDSSIDFLESTKSDLFSDEVFVFTPAGKIIQLPLRATVLDLLMLFILILEKRLKKQLLMELNLNFLHV